MWLPQIGFVYLHRKEKDMNTDKFIYALLITCLIAAGCGIIYGLIQVSIWLLSEMLFHPVRTLGILLIGFAVCFIIERIKG